MKEIETKTILSKRTIDNWWFGTDYNVNLYKGCMHGCIYCDSRSSCYGIEQFDIVHKKKDALQILEKELKGKRYKGIIGFGAMSDPYNIYEQQEELTRNALKLCIRYGYGAAIYTKGTLFLRDLALMKQLANTTGMMLALTITTPNDTLSKKIEPNAPVSSKRFEALEQASNEGIFCGILYMPVLPFINDDEQSIKTMVYQAYTHKAKFIYPMFGLTLRDNQKDYFYEKLDELFPGLKQTYIRTYHNNYVCNSVNAKHLYQVFASECHKYGLLCKMKDIINAYKKQDFEQLSLF